jgi:hypothetical protein
MADDDEDFEIMPHKTIDDLKEEVQKIKGKVESVSSENTSKSIIALSQKISDLMSIFSRATESMKTEGEEVAAVNLEPVLSKLNELEEQNRTIAKSILALADMIEERLPRERPAPGFAAPVQQRPMQQTPGQMPQQMPRPPQPPRHEFADLSRQPPQRQMPEQFPRPQFPQQQFGQLPPMPPGPTPPRGFGELPPIGPLPAPEKKKGLFGMMK